MGILSTIKDTLFNKYNVKDVTGITNAISQEMAEHIILWANIVSGSADWNAENKPCGVIENIAGALSNPVSEEIEVQAENEKLNDIMKQLNEKAAEITQDIALNGGVVCRPIFSNGKVQFELIKLGNYIPTSYDFDGTLTGALLLKEITNKNDHYLLIERHEYKNNTHVIRMELYNITNGQMRKESLSKLEQTADLTEEYTYENVEHPMIVEFRNRRQNKIDGSNVPVPLYGGYENLIKDADEQYNRMNWEQESAKRIIFADEDLFEKRQREDNGEKKIKLGKLRNLLVKIQGSRIGSEKGIDTFSPAIRSNDMGEQFQQILRRLELACNIGKGTLSDMEAVTQTATQYSGGKKALYTAIDNIESEIENKYHACAYCFNYILAAYKLAPFNDKITVTYNEASRKDEIQQKTIALQELQNSVLNPYEYRMKFYGEDEETARQNAPQTPTMDFSTPFVE